MHELPGITRFKLMSAMLRVAMLVAVTVLVAACATDNSFEGHAAALPYESVAPGTVESMGHPKMGAVAAAHEALRPGDDEIVVYYLRNDADYGPWGFWHWAVPGGDGAAAWERSKQLGVIEGVGYLRIKKDGSSFAVPTIGADGLFGIIARKDEAWEKDGDADRIIDARASSAWVIFQNDSKTYPYGPYVPTIEGARLSAKKEIVLELSGRYGLD
ncbi:MAG TPA: alpha-amylase, partial [Spirochaetaceae bacterium]|nr:alpha-amylase [Spirochaetaceae bacterium]